MGKNKMLAAAVNTEAALDQCLMDQVSLFCIENPLYGSLSSPSVTALLSDYDIENYPDKQIAILKKVRGTNPFDENRYEVYYLPLSWDNWHS